MSRSKKKVPIFGHCANSDKIGKQQANRKFRLGIKTRLRKNFESEMPLLREITSVWDMPKDGKYFWAKATPKDLRK